MGGACRGWCVGRVLWLRSISCSPLDGGRTLPRWCYLVGRVQKTGRFGFWGRVTWGNREGEGKSAGFLYGWASEDGAWARCVGRGWDACTGSGRFAPLKRSDLGKSEREVQICQNHCIFHASPSAPAPAPASPPHRSPAADCRLCAPAHLLPQYCTLLGKTPASASPPHRSPAADCRLCAPGLCRPGAASSHRLPTPPGTTRPPANPNPTCKQRNAAPTKR